LPIGRVQQDHFEVVAVKLTLEKVGTLLVFFFHFPFVIFIDIGCEEPLIE